MPAIETVKVEHDSESGFMIINKSDFDEKVHTMYGKKKPTAKKKPVAKKKPAKK